MKLILRYALPYFKMFIGIMAAFLVLFGIHWIAISTGIVLGLLYIFIPKEK